MLKSTYKPSTNAGAVGPLPPGWTEHKAPSGHSYYYNAETKESTYTRPTAPETPSQPIHQDPSASFAQYQSVPNLSDPRVANAYMAQWNQQSRPQEGARRGGQSHGGADSRPKPQPHDKPRSKISIPGCEPWILVYTKYGRRFAYNPAKNASFWRIPEKLKAGILELDQERIRGKAVAETKEDAAPGASNRPGAEIRRVEEEEEEEEGSSEYEEVEVTDDEGGGDDDEDFGDGKHVSKRQRTEEPTDDGPAEFSEADIAFQLQAMGQEYGLDPGEYDDGNPDEWPEGADGVQFSEEDAIALFRDLLDDFQINPYNSWEKLVEEGRLVDDSRYTVLNTTKSRKDVWQQWSKDRIKELKELRAKEEKKDPRIPYMALLQEKATPKLFWPEFKRKFRKEPAMTDAHLKDKDREKWYREHINRLKLPEATRKTDLAALLKSLPATALNNKSTLHQLPSQLLVDVKYISLVPSVRDPLIETYIQTLGPPPESASAVEEDESAQRAKEAKQKREQALREHEERVMEQKRRQQKSLQISRARLREEEREIEMAMHVDKRGLQSQLAALQKPDDKEKENSGGEV